MQMQKYTSLSLIGAIASILSLSTTEAQAQIKADQSLPQPTIIKRMGDRYFIEQGTEVGSNLFHSFDQFSIPMGERASFQNSLQISNIISRVTGSKPSQINGQLESQGRANLYFLNPNGILFGPNAQLKIGGSFLATTAQSIQFKDGIHFSSTLTNPSPLLSVTAPLGLQFGQKPKSLQVQGTGNQLFVDFPFIQESQPTPKLSVQPGKNLSLIGGNITLDGGNLQARDGQIELGSVLSPDLVTLQGSFSDPQRYQNVKQFGAIQLRNASAVDSSGRGSGAIVLHGGEISIREGSTLLARTLGDGQGKGIYLNGRESIEITGFSVDQFGPAFPSSLLTDVAVSGTGEGGSILIRTPNLFIGDGALVSAGTFDQGKAGVIDIHASRTDLLADGPFGASGLFSDTYGPGKGGQIVIQTDTLLIADGAQISASTLPGNPDGAGPGGSIKITAQEVDLVGGSPDSGSSGIFANVETNRPGGPTILTSNQLQILDGAQIATTSFSSGKAGDILIQLNRGVLAGTSPNGITSGIFSNAEGQGAGGQVVLKGRSQPTIQSLQLQAGAQLGTLTFGSAPAGSVQIQVQDLKLLGNQTPPKGTTGILATVESQASGQGGKIAITADRVLILDGAQIAAGTKGTGQGGDLELIANTLEIVGGDRQGRSGVFVNALESTGASGNLEIRAQQISLDQGGTLNASNFASRGNTSTPGQGPAGDIIVTTQTLRLNQQSLISTETAAGDRGNIQLESERLQLANGSQISTNAQGQATGGNIDLTHTFILASENSDITANAQQNFAGNIKIQAKGILGTQYREQLTPVSDITASSDLGPAFRGLVEINPPETDPSKSLTTLPTAVVDVGKQIQNYCQQNVGNSFVVQPSSPPWKPNLSSEASSQAWFQTLKPPYNLSPSSRLSNHPSLSLKPVAQGWKRNEQGQLTLVTRSNLALAASPVTAC